MPAALAPGEIINESTAASLTAKLRDTMENRIARAIRGMKLFFMVLSSILLKKNRLSKALFRKETSRFETSVNKKVRSKEMDHARIIRFRKTREITHPSNL
jgi:hypothetical protein